jgi:hypothetical protein
MCHCTSYFAYSLAVRTSRSYGLLDVAGVQSLVLQVRLAFKMQLTRRMRCITGCLRPLDASKTGQRPWQTKEDIVKQVMGVKPARR